MKKYQTILADPPWDVGFVKLKMRSNQIEMPYETMETYKISLLGIDLRKYLADNCNLFLWATHTYLKASFRVADAWGFKPHCLLTWDKTNGRPCFGFKRITEFVLYAYSLKK